MGLISLFTISMSEASQYVVHRPARCLRKRLNTNQCESCVRACPSGAISIQGLEVIFATEKCSDCMSCVALCPQDAFESSLDLDTVFSGVRSESQPFITCVRQKKRSNEDITVPCVGIFSKQAITSLLFSRCGTISINLSGCEECCNTSVANSFTRRLGEITDFFRDQNTTTISLLLNSDQVTDISCDRRAYLSNITSAAINLVSEPFIDSNSTSPKNEGKRRRIPHKVRLIKELLEKTEKKYQDKISSLFQPELIIGDECDCCPLCKGICPTGALSIDRSSEKVLHFNAADCSFCKLCVEFCKKKALTLRAQTSNL